MATVKDSPSIELSAAPPRWALPMIAIGVCVIVELFVLTTRNRFAEMFEEFELELPLISTAATGLMLPAVLAFVILLAMVKELIPKPRSISVGLDSAVLLFGTVFLTLYVLGIFVPLFKLVSGLS